MGVFDDDIKKRAGNFSLEPRENVWESIEQELETKKRRRPMFWLWWLIPIGLAGGGVVFFTQPSPVETAFIQPADKPVPANSAGDVAQEKESLENVSIHEKDILPATPNTLTQKSKASTGKAIPSKGGLPEKPDEKITESGGPGSVSKKDDYMVKIGMLQASGSTSPTFTIEEEFAQSERAMLSCMAIDKPAPIQAEDPSSIRAEKYAIAIETTGGNEPAPQKTIQANLKKAQWNMVLGAGMHNVSSSRLVETNKSADMYMPPLNNSGGTATNPLNNIIQPSEAGAGLVLGLERTQSLGKKNRWEWLAGLHYQYQTIKISTGARRDSMISTGYRNNTANYYNQGGNSFQTTGSQHRLHLLTGAKLLIGKQRHWAWQNGVFGGVVLANDYLVPLTTQAAWVPSKEATIKGYFGLETGVQFKPNRFGAGLYGQYNLTSSVSSSRLTDQYWSGFELRISYQLFSK